MQKAINFLEGSLFFILTALLYSLFILNLPVFQEPHGLLLTNELSDFSSTQLIASIFFGSVVVCILLGVLMMKWIRPLTAGMAANLWATTFFLLWVDSLFALSVQSQSFHFLILLGCGLLFLYLFFFTVHYLDLREEPEPKTSGLPANDKWVGYWLGSWMVFYFAVSIRLLFNSCSYPEFQGPLAIGFCALCFLNYLVFLFLKKQEGTNLRPYSRIGRIVFSLWFLAILAVEIGQKWIR